MPVESPFEVSYGLYKIHQFDSDPIPLEVRPFVFCTSNVITWFLWLLYMMVQFSVAAVIQQNSTQFDWRMWLLIIGEFFLSFQELVLAANLIFALFCAKDSRTRPRYYLTGNTAPTVDVFVTCCGEAIDIVLDTVAAVISQDFPPQQLRVFVLDDGHDNNLRDAVALLDKKSKHTANPRLHYLSRKVKPGAKSYFKAGNLQFGIDESERLGSSEFLASLDADMIPERDWLRKLVPHLILSGDIGLACPPQCYFNVPELDPLGQKAEFDLWFSIYEPLNDRLDAAMCTGSGYIARRSAMLDIGGWPQVEAGEDFMCSAVLSNNGWKVAFIREDLQFGLAPDSLRSHIKQRMRWVDSGIEVHKQFGFYLPGSKMTSQMTWVQRGVGILMALREYAPMTNLLALLLMPLALFSSQPHELVQITSTRGSSWIWVTFLGSYFAKIVNNNILYGHIGLRKVWNFQSIDMWCSPYTSFRCFISLLPAPVNSLTFKSSGSITSPMNERSWQHRKPLRNRLLSLDMLLYFLYIIYASTPFCVQVIAHPVPDECSRLTYFSLFPGAVLKLLDCISKVSVPLWYMTFPPTVLDREELIETDKRGVRRPKRMMCEEDSRNLPWISTMDLCSFGLLLWWWL